MKNLISIKIVSLGSAIRIINLPVSSTALDIRSHLKLGKSVFLFKDEKELSPTSKLEDGDMIILAAAIKGAVDIKVAGRKWRIYKNDADPKPSNFHAHDYENNLTVDLYTGVTYRNHSQQETGMLSKKEHVQILHYLALSKEQNLSIKAKDVLN